VRDKGTDILERRSYVCSVVVCVFILRLAYQGRWDTALGHGIYTYYLLLAATIHIHTSGAEKANNGLYNKESSHLKTSGLSNHGFVQTKQHLPP
jgi:hypothetical protein